MKKISLLLVSVTLLLAACEEEPLPILFVEGNTPLLDTTYVNSTASAKQDKVVLFEEFTGVRCPNCPKGHEVMRDMKATYPGRVVLLSIHDSSIQQARPFDGEEVLGNEWGAKIFTIISKPNGLPYGIADRMNGTLQSTQWENLVTTRMAVPSVANAEVTVLSYDPVSRELRYEVKFELTEDLTDPVLFSTVIAEDSIISKQEDGNNVIDDYVHNHILRDMPQFSVSLNPGNKPAAVKGRVFMKQYAYKLDPHWEDTRCNLVVYIHHPVEILQAAEVHIR